MLREKAISVRSLPLSVPMQEEQKKQEDKNARGNCRNQSARQARDTVAQSAQRLRIGRGRNRIVGFRCCGAEPNRTHSALTVEIADLCDGICGGIRRKLITQGTCGVRELSRSRQDNGFSARERKQGVVPADKVQIRLRFFIAIVTALRAYGFEIGEAEVQEFFVSL